MQLQYESKDQLPEGESDNFVEFKEGDKITFLHKDLADARKESFRAKGDLTELQSKLQNVSSKLNDYEAREKERLDNERNADEQAKIKGGRAEEIIEDLKRQLGETKAEYEERLNKVNADARAKDKKAVIKDLSAVATKSGKAALERLINQDLDFDDNGGLIVLDSDRKATGKTIEQYKAELANLYPSLVSGVQSQGGLANGATGGGATGAKTVSKSTWKSMSHKQRQDHAKSGGTITD